jgi:hypothetical protein
MSKKQVVDPVSFKAWKVEAFELWLTQWASAYDPCEREKRERERERAVYATPFLSFFLVHKSRYFSTDTSY